MNGAVITAPFLLRMPLLTINNTIKLNFMLRNISFFIVGLSLFSCNKIQNNKEEGLTIKIPSYFPQPTYKFINNPLKKEKFEWGKKLFNDPSLSSDGTISCATCHAQTHAFADHNVPLSAGVNGAFGNRNTPPIFNMIWSKNFMWDGGINHLEIMSVAPLTNPVEMNESMENIVFKLNQSDTHKTACIKAFGTSEITDAHLLKALTIYMSMMVSSNSKYDKVLQKKSNFTLDEGIGYSLFLAKCNQCHTEPLFTNNSYENNGLDLVFNDLGRGKITENSEDNGKFKVPSLRNIMLTYPYMHDGRFWSIDQVLDHYDHGIVHSPTLSPTLSNGISLTTLEKSRLKAFLNTLTDQELIGNPIFF